MNYYHPTVTFAVVGVSGSISLGLISTVQWSSIVDHDNSSSLDTINGQSLMSTPLGSLMVR
jgi:hypothetical protein